MVKFGRLGAVFLAWQLCDERVTRVQAMAIPGLNEANGCVFHFTWGLARPEVSAILASVPMTLTVECEQEFEGRWFAEVPQLPGVHGYGSTRDAATQQALLLAYQLLEAESRLGVKRADADEVYGRQSERRLSAAPPPVS